MLVMGVNKEYEPRSGEFIVNSRTDHARVKYFDRRSLDFTRDDGRLQLVEAAGIEPASKRGVLKALHA